MVVIGLADPSRCRQLVDAPGGSDEWLAIDELLRSGAGAAELSALVRAVGDADPAGSRLALRLTAAAQGADGVAELEALVLSVAGAGVWGREHLRVWLDRWSAAVADVPEAGVLALALAVMRRELDGDATARPSLPPELREIVPRLRSA